MLVSCSKVVQDDVEISSLMAFSSSEIVTAAASRVGSGRRARRGMKERRERRGRRDMRAGRKFEEAFVVTFICYLLQLEGAGELR